MFLFACLFVLPSLWMFSGRFKSHRRRTGPVFICQHCPMHCRSGIMPGACPLYANSSSVIAETGTCLVAQWLTLHASTAEGMGLIHANKALYSQTVIFPVVMYRCESWAIKKGEHQRIEAFKLWCWRRLLNSKEIDQPVHPKWNQLTLNIHWKDWCWSWSSTTLATWYKELTFWKRPWCWERLSAKEEDSRG